MSNLQIYFNAHIEWLKEIVSLIPPGEDLYPMLSMSAPGHPVILLPFPLGPDARVWIKDKLREMRADHYATITAAWITSFDKEEARRMLEHVAAHGTAGLSRQECYVVSAGDRNKTLVAVFVVKRDEMGITLTRRPEFENGIWTGNLCDLLLEAKH